MSHPRRHIVSRAAGAAVLAGMLLCSACVIHLGGWGGETSTSLNGVNVSVRDGRVFAEGVELPFSRWEVVSGSLDPAGAVKLATATGPLTLDGAAGDAYRLEARVFSEVEGDGVPGFVDGALTVTPTEGRQAIIDGIRGTLPAGIQVEASSGTGEVRLAGFDGGRDLRLQSGTALIALARSKVGRLELDSGTAEIELDAVEGSEVHLVTGTGDVVLEDCTFETGRFDSGTGDLGFVQGHIGKLWADTGTGDVEFRGTRVDALEVESGTGDVLISQGAVVAVVKADLGTGDVIRR